MRKLFFSTLAVLLLIAAVATPPAMAVGTAVGTTISNQAYGDYKDANGNDRPRVWSNTVTITVAQVYGLNITPPTSSNSGGNAQTVYFPGKVYNLGNGSDTYTISWDSTGGTWSPTSVAMYADVNDNGVYDAGTDTLIEPTVPGGNSYLTGAIAADAYASVIMAVVVPDNATAPDGSQNVITVTVTSNGDSSKTQQATCTTTVSAAVISAVKSSAVSVVPGTTTPKATPTFRPGDEVMWTVTMTNTGSATAEAIRAVDVMDANTTFVTGSLEVRFVYPAGSIDTGWMPRTQACSSSSEACFDSATKTILIPGNGVIPSPHYLPPGATYYVRARTTINAGVSWDTTISNVANITYTSGDNTINVNTNTASFTVEQLAGITMTKISVNKSGNPGDQIVYRFDVTNAGNKTDSFDLTTNSSNGWTWAYWLDVDNNGVPGTDGDYLLTDTNGNGTVDTGNLAQSGVVHLLAVATVPAGRADGTTDTLTVTGTSFADATKTASLQWTTTVTAPVLAITKELVRVVHPAGVPNYSESPCTPTNKQTGAGCSYYPGSVVTYQITATNNGTGNLTHLVLVDQIPANMTYVTGTIRAGDTVATLTPKTDAADGDGGQYDSGAVMSGLGSTINLGPTATWVVEFQATIN
ncbi:MAG TPA: hypothetical protein PLT45_05975 [Smithella sp.]|nr:hypothetical protein [Smithella sp.]